MNDNMKIYDAVRSVPENAKKKIGGGRLKGMTDINPMWRIKTLTEQFGVCGAGWYAKIEKQWLEPYENGEVSAFCNVLLYVKIDGQWSEPIYGTGGAKYVTKENNGLYVDDEAYKKAFTDAISVSCKMLGIGADVYWDKDITKYTQPEQESELIESGKLRFEIEQAAQRIGKTMDYVESLAQKNLRKSFEDASNFELGRILDFLRQKENAV